LLTIDLPEDGFSLLRKSPTEFGGELRLAVAVQCYELGMLSSIQGFESGGA
jgi:Uncharacterised protein family (UPF0175)